MPGAQNTLAEILESPESSGKDVFHTFFAKDLFKAVSSPQQTLSGFLASCWPPPSPSLPLATFLFTLGENVH